MIYLFLRLTVEDSDHVTNSTSANITVLKVTDYPPSANAGQDVIIYLPQNTLTLNGNLSTDDRGIASWEWTKSPSDQNKAVDMQNTRTPYLQLSNLEEGMYTFVLKVTDDSEQSSMAEVHVFVKPPTNKPPKGIVIIFIINISNVQYMLEIICKFFIKEEIFVKKILSFLIYF